MLVFANGYFGVYAVLLDCWDETELWAWDFQRYSRRSWKVIIPICVELETKGNVCPPPNTWFFEVTEPLRYSSPLFSQMISLDYCLLVRLLGSWLIVCYPGGWWSVLCVTWKVVRRICCVSNDKKELLCTRVLFDRLWVAIRCA